MSFSIIPRKVYETSSPFSGQIVVEEQLGLYSLSVQNLIQSGGLVKGIWRKVLKRINSQFDNLVIRNCLVLGLGGGTVVKLIKKYWPEAKIIGLEIDPEIIKISQKYFGLDQIEDLKIIQADAFKWLQNYNLLKDCNFFDLIIVDLYLGRQFPKQAEKPAFFQDLKKHLTAEGIIVFNRLRTAPLKKFAQILKKHFGQIEQINTVTNSFFTCRR